MSIIGRRGPIRWGDPRAVAHVANGAQLLISLSGKNVGCRYDSKARNEILNSQDQATHRLHGAVFAVGKASNGLAGSTLKMRSGQFGIFRRIQKFPAREISACLNWWLMTNL
ncbi:MAG TPA: hypothetical protein DCY59_10205 [Micrococcaceae bacterium]|nr:hypothetical protein [Micrococcaceae bacterium]